MECNFRTNRRRFLTAAATTATSALAAGSWTTHLQGQVPKNPLRSADAASTAFNDLYDTSVLATSLKGEAADRLALRRLVDAWAHCADRRLAERQSDLFIPDGVLMNYEGDPKTHEPHSTIKGRSAIRSALAVLNTFIVTLHLNGQSDVHIQGTKAIGETYCLVHQFILQNGERKCQTLGIRYHGQFLLQDDHWYFAERKLIIDWSDSRVSTP